MMYLLVLVAAASRFLPHPPNVACVAALGLFAGCYMAGRKAYLVPLGVMLCSDAFGQAFGLPGLGFYSPITMIAVYAGMIAAVPLGRMLRDSSGVRHAVYCGIASLSASTAFFLISNFGHWMAGWYPMTPAGLVTCYIAAVPFYAMTLAGDLCFTTILMGCYALSQRHLGSSVHRDLVAVGK